MARDDIPYLSGSFRYRHYIREWRQHRGLTQKQVAEKTSFTHGALSHVETARASFSGSMLAEIANALDVEPAALFYPPGESIDEFLSFTPDQRKAAMSILKQMQRSARNLDFEKPNPNRENSKS